MTEPQDKDRGRKGGDSLPLLVRLWRDRARTLEEGADLVINNKALQDSLRSTALAYQQCAKELEGPPNWLFAQLEYTSPNATRRGPEDVSPRVQA